jgi:hypothetical protein
MVLGGSSVSSLSLLSVHSDPVRKTQISSFMSETLSESALISDHKKTH